MWMGPARGHMHPYKWEVDGHNTQKSSDQDGQGYTGKPCVKTNNKQKQTTIKPKQPNQQTKYFPLGMSMQRTGKGGGW